MAIGDRTCTYMSCTSKHFARGLCDKHYRRYRRKGFVEHPKDLVTDEGKPCGECKVFKLRSEYILVPKRADGLTWSCRNCHNKRTNQWRIDNLERKKNIELKSRTKHADKWLERSKVNRHRRRKNVKETGRLITIKELNKIYSNPCVACGSTERQSLDHIVPLSRGGTHTIGNIQTLCQPCNSGKCDKTMMEWRLAKAVK